MRSRIVLLTALLLSLGVLLRAQHQHSHSGPEAASTQQDLAQTTEAMSHQHGGHEDHEHAMGPHMKMSTLRPASAADTARAQQLVDQARTALDKYKDVSVAEADGFKQFLPNVKQKMYHYTSWKNAIAAAFKFDPEHPTSLLYEPQPNGRMKLIGAMYTAPARFSEDQLNERIPLSVSQWHQHVNLCVPPKDQRQEMFTKNPRFGLNGSISTEAECQAAGGTFRPRIFGWMVHFYPYEKAMDEIWSVERQRNTVIPTDNKTAATVEHNHH